MKTLNILRTKPWYRLLKILYVLVLLATTFIIYNVYVPSYDSFLGNVVQPFLIVLLVLEIIKRSVYYIYSGSISPINVEIATYLKQIKEELGSFQDTTDFPDTSKNFLEDISRVAKLEIEKFEKDNAKKDIDRLSQVANLVTSAKNLYRPIKSRFTPITHVQVSVLYHAHKLGMDIDSFKVQI
jgi:DNA integrity scanning protein DisA with diadenylate cyclase activity